MGFQIQCFVFFSSSAYTICSIILSYFIGIKRAVVHTLRLSLQFTTTHNQKNKTERKTRTFLIREHRTFYYLNILIIAVSAVPPQTKQQDLQKNPKKVQKNKTINRNQIINNYYCVSFATTSKYTAISFNV